VTILILGRRELGKSTLAAYLARRCDRRVILDPRHMFPTSDPVGDMPGDTAEFTTRLYGGDPEIVVQPGQGLEATNDRLAAILTAGYHAPDRLAIVLDDASLIDFDPWATLIRTAPRDRVYLIVTAHRPQDVPTWVRAIADEWCLFKMTQEHDLRMIDAQCGEVVARKVANLKPQTFLAWDDATADPTKQVTLYLDPRVWYVPMGARAIAAPSRALVPNEGVPIEEDEDETVPSLI
jgi:hypothetical protein